MHYPARMVPLTAVLMVLLSLALTGFVHWIGQRMMVQDAARRLGIVASMQAQALEAQMTHQGHLLLAIAQMPEVQALVRPLTEDFTRLRLRTDPVEARAQMSQYLEKDLAPAFERRQGRSLTPAELANLQPAEDALAAQLLYLAQNRFPYARKADLVDAGDGSDYSRVHARAQILLRGIQERFNLSDLYLVDALTGRVVFSLFKNPDFATSLDKGPWSATGLAEAFRHARAMKAGQIWISDWAAHLPSLDETSAFAATPIVERGNLQAVLIAREPIDRINELLGRSGRAKAAGLGTSGEVVLIGRDGALRSAGRVTATPLPATLLAAIEADGGGSGVYQIQQRPQVVAFAPVTLQGQLLHVLARLDVKEATQGLLSLSASVLGAGLLLSLLATAMAWRWSRRRPEAALAGDRLKPALRPPRRARSGRDFFLPPGAGPSPATSAPAGNVASAEEPRIPIAAELADALSDALGLLTSETGRVLNTVGVVAQELAEYSLALQALQGGEGPVPQPSLARLSGQAAAISQVVTIIQAIAERSNVLALNALIHAAAAGESGRSFGLLANEVRRLSDSARESTRLIARLASAIQGGVDERGGVIRLAAEQLAEISKLADQVNHDVLRTRDEADRLSQRIRSLAQVSDPASLAGLSQDPDRLIRDAGLDSLRQMQSQASETKRLVDYAKNLLHKAQVQKLPE